MKAKVILTALVLVACASAYLVYTLPADRGLIVSPVYASPAVTAQQATIDGRPVGEVLVDGQVVFRIRTFAGGLTPYQRAQVVADRLEQLMGDTLQPEDITTGRANGQDVVLADGRVVITADRPHARLNQTSPMQLADLWALRLENAVAGRPVTETPVAQKIVPIISVGQGVRVGGAVVAGARNRLDEVVAVAQVEGQFGNAVRVRVLVPVSTEDVVREIRRVPQTSVIGLADIRL